MKPLKDSPCDETRKDIQEVIAPVGVSSGMTKRLAISDGSHTPGLTAPAEKRRSRKD